MVVSRFLKIPYFHPWYFEKKVKENLGKIFENLFSEAYIYLKSVRKGGKNLSKNFIILLNHDNSLKKFFLGSWNQQQVYLTVFLYKINY